MKKHRSLDPERYEYYKGYSMAQRVGVIDIFNKLFEKEKFDIVIEIGTGIGMNGFAYYLCEKFQKKFYTFEIGRIKDAELKMMMESTGAHVIRENIFKTNTIKKLIEQDKRVLLLCDGGDKPKEVKQFGQLLKTGDVVMAHDYFKTRQDQNDDIWWTCETVARDMDLRFLREDKEYTKMFTPYVWGIRIKK